MSEAQHRRITTNFIMSLRPILDQPPRQALGGMMVCTETTMLGVMEILNQLFDLKPADCAGMMETALDQAIKRFSEKQNKEGKT